MIDTVRPHTLWCPSPGSGYRMAYREWGDPDGSHVLLCVHGLSRNGRDFDMLAGALADDCRVVCPDLASCALPLRFDFAGSRDDTCRCRRLVGAEYARILPMPSFPDRFEIRSGSFA